MKNEIILGVLLSLMMIPGIAFADSSTYQKPIYCVLPFFSGIPACNICGGFAGTQCPNGYYCKYYENADYGYCIAGVRVTTTTTTTILPQVCTQEAKQCSDGSFVYRDPRNNCEFYPCPSVTTTTQTQPGCYEIGGTCVVAAQCSSNNGQKLGQMNCGSDQTCCRFFPPTTTTIPQCLTDADCNAPGTCTQYKCYGGQCEPMVGMPNPALICPLNPNGMRYSNYPDCKWTCICRYHLGSVCIDDIILRIKIW